MPQTKLIDSSRLAFRRFLLERGIAHHEVATKTGLSRVRVAVASHPKSKGFGPWRDRMRIERALGVLFWTPPDARDHIAAIGEKLGIDLLTVDLREIKAAALKAGLKMLPIYGGLPVGFHIFREIIAHYFPESKILREPELRDAIPYTIPTGVAGVSDRSADLSRSSTQIKT